MTDEPVLATASGSDASGGSSTPEHVQASELQPTTAAQQRVQVVDAAADHRFDGIIRLAQGVFGMPLVAVNLVDEEHQHTRAAAGFPIGSIPRELSICGHTLEEPGIMEVPDLREHPVFATNPLVAELGLRYYVGAPLHAPTGQLIGRLCLGDNVPRKLTDREETLLKDLAAWVERELATEDDLLHAARVQRTLLPRRQPDLPGVDIAGVCLPAREIGGDFFDWMVTGDNLHLMIADVMGKGLPAALLATEVRATIRAGAPYNDLATNISRTSLALRDDFEDNGSFVTVFAARLDAPSGELEYVDAGHGMALILSPDGSWRQLTDRYLPLGLPTDDHWTSAPERLEIGEVLITISDGVMDVFGTREKAIEHAFRTLHHYPDAAAMAKAITKYAIEHGSTDDVTAVVVRRVGE